MKFKANYTLQQMQNMRTKEQLKKKKKKEQKGIVIYSSIYLYIYSSMERELVN